MQKEYRLTKNEQFRSIYKHGKSVANRQLVLYYMQNQDVSHFRLGVTVSKKLGKAVVRNRIKRVVKEVVRHNAGHIPHGYDLVIIVRKQALEESYASLGKSFKHVLKRASLYKPYRSHHSS
jgi:ribonuclease P protein component